MCVKIAKTIIVGSPSVVSVVYFFLKTNSTHTSVLLATMIISSFIILGDGNVSSSAMRTKGRKTNVCALH